MPEIDLLDGEQIIEKITPSILLRKYFFVSWMLSWSITILVAGLVVSLRLTFSSFIDELDYNLTLMIIIIILIIVTFLLFALANAAYFKYCYWITNKRVITKRGVIGYQITSIPLERISDVIISRSFLETLCGISSLHIQSLAGQITPGSPLGGEGRLLAIPNPEVTQNKILELVKEKRREERLSF